MSKETQIKLRRHLVNPSVPPKPAHQFMWTRVGTDIVLEVGYFDLPELRTALQRAKDKGQPAETSFYVTDRFTLTPTSVASLVQAGKDLARDMEQQRMLASSEGEVKH
jgi:hypothetical protein